MLYSADSSYDGISIDDMKCIIHTSINNAIQNGWDTSQFIFSYQSYSLGHKTNNDLRSALIPYVIKLLLNGIIVGILGWQAWLDCGKKPLNQDLLGCCPKVNGQQSIKNIDLNNSMLINKEFIHQGTLTPKKTTIPSPTSICNSNTIR